MSRLSRLLALVVSVALLVSGLPFAAHAAQQAGETTLLDPSGNELGTVTIQGITDPFELYDPGNPPIRGYHFVLVTLAVENTGKQPFKFDPGDLILRDTDGFLYGTDTVYRAEDAAEPDLKYQDVPAGETVSGAVGFQVLNDVQLSGLWLIPGSGQLVLLQHLGGTPSGIGDAAAWIAHDGSDVGTVSVTELIDPYEDYPPGDPPQRGSHYVRLELLIENTGDRAIQIDPNDVLLQDTDGFLYGAESVESPEGGPPELEYGDLAPGSSASGTIAFSVVNGVTLARVLYQPAGDRLLIPVDLTDSGGAGVPDERDDTGDETPAADDDATTASTDDIDCDEITDWLEPVYADSSAVFQLVGQLMVMAVEEDPEYVDTAHQIAQAFLFTAEQLESQPVPDAVADLNDDLVAAYTAYGEALGANADAIDGGDENEITQAGQALYDAEPALIEAITAVEELAVACDVEPAQ